MNHAATVMSGVSVTLAIAGIVIFTRPTTSEHAVYIKRISGTMAFAGALILALFAFGLAWVIPQ